MKLWENTALTEKGTALQNKLFDGQTLKITGAKAGAGEVPSVNLRQQTQITDERQEITLQPVRTEDGKAVIPVLLKKRGSGSILRPWSVPWGSLWLSAAAGRPKAC